ncbi:hemerythrin domain-containing protein [Vibrio sp. ZSDZ34]|jgi:hemerythrin-like domain-containing protein|uniref:Hemerythrin domain-containing protein n=1 Tax=Vibrio gelatinilyticus TaxID=2893468 RepID=A0A9X1W9R0_9VIBR|nr:hemerythrin domain-containing protein [Vibrio gelatinilyticus]MCJ2376086.1 hemerythrin domain-containing protein [Vibrio gelatinilyticus]
MTSIQEFMTQHHKQCDDLLVDAEGAIAANDWTEFALGWNAFEKETLHHFELEEQVLFPEFEAQTGMVGGPTNVMRQEHSQIRAMFEQMQQAIAEQNQERAIGVIESTMLFIQQHNMKEEQILYPMSDNRLNNGEELVARMKSQS